MAEGQEPGRRVFLPAQCYCFLEGPWGSCWPGRVSMDGSGRELLMDRSMATPFSCSQLPLEQRPCPCLPPTPACMILVPQALQCTQAAVLELTSRCGTVKEGGSGLGCSHGCTLRG